MDDHAKDSKKSSIYQFQLLVTGIRLSWVDLEVVMLLMKWASDSIPLCANMETSKQVSRAT
jgi:hypothetical protein